MSKALLLALLFIMVASCVTVPVNITFQFPEEEMKKALFEMEKEMRERADKEAASSIKEMNASNKFIPAFVAQDVDIKVNTPAITAINARREDRYTKLKPHYEAGRIGEGKDATLVIRNEEGLSGKDKALFKRLIKQENDDRAEIMQEILKANKLDNSSMATLQEVYANSLQELANKGWWIETSSGWKQK